VAKRKSNGTTVDDEVPALVANIRSPAPDLGPRALRMIARILEATRTVFLAKGYAGTTIDEIARTADISRASFYTYFPTKRDVLIALGADSASTAEAALERYVDGRGRGSGDVLDSLVDDYFVLLDEHGAFATAWTQAAQEDDDIRAAGMRRHMKMCADIGRLLGAKGRGVDPAIRGLAAYSLVERAWSFARLYGDDLDLAAFKAEVVRMLRNTLTDPAPIAKPKS
jgi:AcrR family transcriptional regulator